jgi:hypothetical protein
MKNKKNRNKFESIWSLGKPPNDLFTLYFHFFVIYTELGFNSWAKFNLLLFLADWALSLG